MARTLRHRLVFALIGVLVAASTLVSIAPVAADAPQAGVIQDTHVIPSDPPVKDDRSDLFPDKSLTASGADTNAAPSNVVAPVSITFPSVQQADPRFGSGTQMTNDGDRN